MRKTLLAIVVVALVAIIFVQTENAQDSKGIQFGAVLSLTGGTSAFYGEYAQRGLEIARAEVNGTGGILGENIEIVYEDSGGDKTRGVNAINKLIQADIDFVFADPVSGVTLAMAPVAEKNEKILFAPGASNPLITNAGDYIFRTKMSATIEGEKAGKYIAQDIKPKRVAFIYQNSDYGKGVFESFKKELIKENIQIVENEQFAMGSTDMRTNLTNIKQVHPDLVVIAAFPKEVGIVMKQAKELNLDTKFFAHSGSIGPDIDLIAGSAAEGLTYLTELDFSPDNKKFESFARVYREKYAADPELFSSIAYDAFMLAADAVKSCGSTSPQCVKGYLYSVKDYAGVSGVISFDQNGDILPRELRCVMKRIDGVSGKIKDMPCK